MKFINCLNLTLLSLLLSNASLFAQDFDEAYLESLAKEIREQVLQSNELKQELEEPNYRRPDSSLELKESDETVLSRFGMRIFKSMQTSFMPVNEPNVDSEYILDFGDVLEIQLVGPKSYIQKTDIITLQAKSNRAGIWQAT